MLSLKSLLGAHFWVIGILSIIFLKRTWISLSGILPASLPITVGWGDMTPPSALGMSLIGLIQSVDLMLQASYGCLHWDATTCQCVNLSVCGAHGFHWVC